MQTYKNVRKYSSKHCLKNLVRVSIICFQQHQFKILIVCIFIRNCTARNTTH